MAANDRRFGFDRLLTWSAVAGSLIVAGFALIGPQTPYWIIVSYVFIFGLARGAQFMTSNTLSYSDMIEYGEAAVRAVDAPRRRRSARRTVRRPDH